MPPSTIVTLLVFCFWLSSVRGRRKRVKKTTFFLLKTPYHWSVHPEPVIKSVTTVTWRAPATPIFVHSGVCTEYAPSSVMLNDVTMENAKARVKNTRNAYWFFQRSVWLFSWCCVDWWPGRRLDFWWAILAGVIDATSNTVTSNWNLSVIALKVLMQRRLLCRS